MVKIRVEAQLVAATAQLVRSFAQFRVLQVCRHVRIPEHDHVLIVAQINIRVLGHSRLLVIGREQKVVVVVVDSEDALEQRRQSVSCNGYPRPANIVPAVPSL
jgi:hypothetical protein